MLHSIIVDEGEQHRKPSFREFGAPWIAAVGSLLAGLGAAGFFTGRATAPVASSSAAPAVTVTVTTTRGPAAPAPTRPDPGDPAIFFSGELVWGKFNLDQAEPKTVGDNYIVGLTEDMLYVNGGNSTLAMWETDSVPSKGQCASRVTTDGSNQVNNLVAGNRVCGKTDEGRIFRIEILATGSSGIRSKTTVWTK